MNDCMEQYAASAPAVGLSPTAPAVAALLFHDVVYDPRSSTNEEDSAVMAGAAARELLPPSYDAARLTQLIMFTKHGVAAPDGADIEGSFLVDVDLSILGRSWDVFAVYDAGIRAEYAWYPVEAFREGRRGVLARFLDEPAIYRTRAMRDAYEAPARANLRRAIEELTSART